MPAISLETMQRILPREKQQSIIDSVFGPKEQTPSASEQAAAVRDQRFQDWLNSRKQAVEQQRTDATKMARFNALGNVLTTMVQPLGWAVGGSTAGVQPVDNRQYLDAFNRAVKASDDLRNIGTLEGEYQFKLADEAYKRAQAMEDAGISNAASLDLYQKKADIDITKQTAIDEAKHNTRMKEIDQRYGWQKDITEIRGKYRITQNGITVSDSAQLDAEKKFNTAWKDYTTRIATLDATPGIDMSKIRIMSKEEFYKWYMEGNGYQVQDKSDNSVQAPYVVAGSGSGSGAVTAPYVK